MIVELGFDNFVQLPIANARILRKLFKKYDKITIFDIGSCEGEDSIRYANFFPNCTIHLFEPIPSNYSILKSNIKRYGLDDRIKTNKLALSNKQGDAIMYKSSGKPKNVQPKGKWDYGNKSSSLLAPHKTIEITPWLMFKEKVRVKTQTIDIYCNKNNINTIDFIHMDVQGAELLVLEGSSKMLNNLTAIWLEAEAVELYKGQALKNDLENFMKSIGFVKIVDTVNEIAGDQLYVNSKKLHLLSQRKNNLSFSDRLLIYKEKLYLAEPNKFGFSLYLPKNQRWTFSENDYYEENVTFWTEKILDKIKHHKNQSLVVYDIGGNNGFYSLMFSEVASEVHVFEPSKASKKIINLNLKLNQIDNVALHNFALSDKKGVLEFYTYSSSGNDSLIRRSIPIDHELKFKKSYKVKVEKLDNLNISPPDFIKIDVEGAELPVIKGGINKISQYGPAMMIEYSEDTSRDAGYKRELILDILEKHGYSVLGLNEDNKSLKTLDVYKNSKTVSNIIAIKDKRLLKQLLELSQCLN